MLYLRVQDPAGNILDGDVSPFPGPVNNLQRLIVPNPGAGRHPDRGLRVLGDRPLGRRPDRTGSRQSYALAVANSRP
jgi:hypothetical protein